MKIFRDTIRAYISKVFLVDEWLLEDPMLTETGDMAIVGIETPAKLLYVSDHQINCVMSFIIKYRYPKSTPYHSLPLHEIEEIAVSAIAKLGDFYSREATVEAAISPVSKDWILSITLDLASYVLVDPNAETTETLVESVRLLLRSNIDIPPDPAYDKTFTRPEIITEETP